jgi:hypothetical protein
MLGRPAIVAAVLTAALILVLFALASVLLDEPRPTAERMAGVLLPQPPSSPAPIVAGPQPEQPSDHRLTVSSVTAAAYAGLPPKPPANALAAAPDPDLIEFRDGRRLPRIGADGRLVWQAYSRPFDLRDDRPRVAVVLLSFGLSGVASEAALRHLPAEVSLVIDAYAPDPASWAKRARESGHEVLIGAPVDPAGRIAGDPGPHALSAAVPASENLARLESLLSSAVGAIGVIALNGGPLIEDPAALRSILQALHGRGLLFVYGNAASRPSAVRTADEVGVARIWADLRIDNEPTATAIDTALEKLETIALSRGVAVALAQPYPITLKRLSEWWPALERRNLALAPVSAAAGAQVLH